MARPRRRSKKLARKLKRESKKARPRPKRESKKPRNRRKSTSNSSRRCLAVEVPSGVDALREDLHRPPHHLLRDGEGRRQAENVVEEAASEETALASLGGGPAAACRLDRPAR